MIPKKLNDLELVLDLPNKEDRIEQLKSLADKLGMLPRGEADRVIDEQQLVLAIFDGFVAEEFRIKKQRWNLLLIIFVVIFSIAIAPLFKEFVIDNIAKFVQTDEIYQGYNDDGELIKNKKGKIELFKDMEGYYDEFYDDGIRHFSYRYEKGSLVEQMEFDREGELIAHYIFDKNGNPTLIRKGR